MAKSKKIDNLDTNKKSGLKIVWVDISELKAPEYNPRKASKEQFEQLKKSIQKFGFVDPIIVNCAPGRENIVIGGNFRVEVAKALGIKKIPAVYVCIQDIEKEQELNLRLNKNTGEWDWELLANFSEDMLLNVGFSLNEVAKIMTYDDVKFFDEDKTMRKFNVIIKCTNEEQLEHVMELLKISKRSVRYEDFIKCFGN